MNFDAFNFEACYQRKVITGHKHYHDTFELYFLEEGQCSYLIDDKLYDVEEGDLVLIPERVIHSVTYTDQHSRLLINCRDSFFEPIPFPKEPVYRNADISGEIHTLFQQIEQEFHRDDPYSPLLLQGAMRRLLALLNRNTNQYPIDREENRLIAVLLREMNSGFSGTVTLTEAAKRHCVSPAHLSRTFKRETGMNFNEYLSLLRLKKAEQLLRQEQQLSISEIALACGFNDSNYFSEKFHTANGCSPTAFRRQTTK